MLLPVGAAGEPQALLFRDVHAPDDLLPEIAAARAVTIGAGRELILLTSNWGQWDLAVNLVAALAKLGMQNYWLLADNAALVEHARRRRAIATSWSSLLESFAISPNATTPACACFGRGNFRESRPSTLKGHAPRCLPRPAADASSRCLLSAAAFYKADAVRRLWLLRFHYAARLVGLGYNVLLLDSDSLVLANPFLLINTHLSAVAAIGLEDISAWPQLCLNGGTWYFRARPNGPVHMAMRSVGRRARRVLEAYPETRHFDQTYAKKRPDRPPKPADFLLFDQTLINLVLVEALVGRRVDLTNSTVDRLQPIKHNTPEHTRIEWTRTCCHPTPPALGHPPWGLEAGGMLNLPANLASLPRTQREARLHYGAAATLRLLTLPASGGRKSGGKRSAATATLGGGGGGGGVPGGSGSEMLLKAPPWLFSAESDAGGAVGRTVATMWGAKPPPAAVVHFVCSSWPGSDGRRTAMRAWGHWHAEAVEAEMDERMVRTLALRRRGFVSFDGPVPAASPKELEPYYRLLSLFAHATRRTPVLPTMRCDLPGQRWISSQVDARTGSPLPPPAKGAQGSGRPCGWAIHYLGGEQLPEPLCVQRPTEGCFLAFATPDEISAHLPAGYWNGTAAHGTAAASASPGPPSVEGIPKQPRAASLVEQALQPSRRAWAELSVDLVHASALPFVLPQAPDPGGTDGFDDLRPPPQAASAAAAALLLLRVPRRGALKEQPLLSQTSAFDAAVRKLSGSDRLGAARGLGAAWHGCLGMVNNPKCTSVC